MGDLIPVIEGEQKELPYWGHIDRMPTSSSQHILTRDLF